MSGRTSTSPSYVPTPPPPVARTDGSLWPGKATSVLFCRQSGARYVNDIVTITVNESAEGTKDVTTKTSNKSDNSAAIKAFLGLPLNLGIKNLVGLGTALGSSYETMKSNSYDGSGSGVRDVLSSAKRWNLHIKKSNNTSRSSAVMDRGTSLIRSRVAESPEHALAWTLDDRLSRRQHERRLPTTSSPSLPLRRDEGRARTRTCIRRQCRPQRRRTRSTCWVT